MAAPSTRIIPHTDFHHSRNERLIPTTFRDWAASIPSRMSHHLASRRAAAFSLLLAISLTACQSAPYANTNATPTSTPPSPTTASAPSTSTPNSTSKAPPAWHYLDDSATQEFTALFPKPPALDASNAAKNFETRLDWIVYHSASRRVIDNAKAMDKEDLIRDFAPIMGPAFTADRKPVIDFVNLATADINRITGSLKNESKRSRPQLPVDYREGDQETGFAYPSGHATRAGARARLLAAIDPDNAQLELDLLREATLMAFNRVVLVRHYPSDVTAGLALGQSAAQKIIDKANADPTSAAGVALEAARKEWKANKK